jgi:HAD superfamily hydrolase (TIGR01484 family)
MRYLALATDYDGTLASQGKVFDRHIDALERLAASGRRLIMVTGRHLPDLKHVFPRLDLFHLVVAENGALLYNPATKEERVLGEPPPRAFSEELKRRGASPVDVGHAIVATWHPHETLAVELIGEMGLDLQVIFNKGAVMILPAGVNKGSGLMAALDELGLSPHNVIGFGDAENDQVFLSMCECGVAVSNALPTVKELADVVTEGDHGDGVAEMIEQLLEDDLASLEPSLQRNRIVLGTGPDEKEVTISTHGSGILIAGPSGSGKSTALNSVIERLSSLKYQYCLIDPEGDYEELDGALILGDTKRVPSVNEVMNVLEKPEENVAINLLGLSLEDRPSYFAGLIPRVQELRTLVGRPHWTIIDEAHHLLPAAWDAATMTIPQDFSSVILITVHPDKIARPILNAIDVVIAVGKSPDQTIAAFCDRIGEPAPSGLPPDLEAGHVLVWFRNDKGKFVITKLIPAEGERKRHGRKYAEGELPPERSFYFTGPDERLNLRAQNLVIFNQMAEGVDDDTWLFHLKRGDYSKWFREFIKDEDLASEAADVEGDGHIPADESRAKIRQAIEKRYSGPA